MTFNADLIYDVLRKYEPDHVLLRATRQDAARGLVDLGRLAAMLARVRRAGSSSAGCARISPLAVPVLLEIGKEQVDGRAVDELLDEAARALIDEATGRRWRSRTTGGMTALAFTLRRRRAGGRPSGGALCWPAEATLVVADLHLEKGASAGAARHAAAAVRHAATLAALVAADRQARAAPRRLPRRQLPRPAEAPSAVRRRRSDAAGPWPLGGDGCGSLAITTARRPPALRRGRDGSSRRTADASPPGDGGGGRGEVSGHFHPKASVAVVAAGSPRRCFVGDEQRLILPAFGAYTGGLDVFDPAIASLLDAAFSLVLLGRRRVHRLPGCRRPTADACRQHLNPPQARATR